MLILAVLQLSSSYYPQVFTLALAVAVIAEQSNVAKYW